MASGDALTEKQALFCIEYLVDLNASAAARRAGYSEGTAGEIGYQLLQNTSIWIRIAELMEARAKRTGVTADRIVKQLERIAFGDPRRVASWGPDGVVLRDSEELSEDDAALVSGVSSSPGQYGMALKWKRTDQLRALELLMKHKGMLREGGGEDGEIPEPKQIIFTVEDASAEAEAEAA